MSTELTGTSRPPLAEYRSAFGRWNERSWVRSKPHRLAPFEPQLEFFSATVAPLFSHPEVQAAGSEVRTSLLVLHLHDWLEFTEWLELGPVNRACELLRRKHFLQWLPAEMRADALKIYTDEAGHAEMSHALGEAVASATGVASLRLRPAFLDTFDRMVRSAEPEYEPLLTVLFATVSETLITGSLKQLPEDETVQRAVRDLAKDHEIDEGLHHAFFRNVFMSVWPRLPLEMRHLLGPLLPRMILAFLEPDRDGLERMLAEHRGTFADPRRIADEVVHGAFVRAMVEQASRPTVRIIMRAGGFEEPGTAAAFRECGLSGQIAAA